MIHGRCKTRLAGESRTCSSRCWAFLIVALLAGVVFGVITVGRIEAFGVILGPLVALVSGTVGFHFARKCN